MQSPAITPSPRRPSLKQRLAAWMRWLHIYSSMLGLAAVLFFSVTGLTLNHPDWMFGSARQEQQLQATLPSALAARIVPIMAEEKIPRLEIVEHLRREYRLGGLVDEFLVEADTLLIAFKGPAFSADILIQRADGSYELTQLSEGWVALINDLHKGRHTGPVWSAVIDASAILLILISLTGLLLLLYIKRRRLKGLLLAAAALVLFVWLACL